MNRTRTLVSIVLLGVLLTSWGGGSPARVQAQAGWLEGWTYRREVRIDNASGPLLENYQVLVTLNAANFDFGRTQPDGRDVRFTNSNGTTLLPFWIEEWNPAGPVARIWVKVPLIPAGAPPTGGTTIYLYYGNLEAPAASDGDATFVLFDDEWLQFGGGPANPVHTATQSWWESNVSFPVVFEDTSFPDRPGFHMLYDGHAVIGHAKGYATSPDLIHWTEYDNGLVGSPSRINPILGTGYTGDDPFAWGDVMKVGSTYHMYVSRGPGTINHTESTDLIHWTNPVQITGGSFGTGAAILKEGDGITPIVVDGRYWMVYFPGAGPGDMYLASAPVGGNLLVWEPYTGNPILTEDTAGGFDALGLWTPSFARLGNTYYIYYQGNGPAGWETGFAKAAAYDGGDAPIRPDAVAWTKSDTNADGIPDSVIKNGSGWDSTYCIDPMIREFDGVYYVFYTGNAANGYAHSTGPEGPWIKLGEEAGPTEWAGGGTLTVSGGVLTLGAVGTAGNIMSNSTFLYHAVGYRAIFPSGSRYTWAGFINGSAGVRTMIGTLTTNASNLYLKNYVSAENNTSLGAGWFGAFHVYEVLWRSGQSRAVVDHGAATATSTLQVPTSALSISFFNYIPPAGASPVQLDWVFVRKYNDPEPTAAVQGEVTAVRLVSWTANPAGKAILLEWETATEVDNLGFNLYRDNRVDGPFARLNDTLIPSQAPGSPLGAVYSWLDGDVQPGVTYYYKLEDVDIYGNRTQHGPVWARAYLHVYLPVVIKD